MEVKPQSKAVEWFRSFFDEDYPKIYAGKEADTATEVTGIINVLGLKPGAQILDLASGYGRISIPLAEKGYQVTCVDLSEPLLKLLRDKLKGRNLPIKGPIREDMREINFVNEFDAVINIFSSFGYFIDQGDDVEVVRLVHKALKPDGKFLIDLDNVPFFLRSLPEDKTWRVENGGFFVRKVSEYDAAEDRRNIYYTVWKQDKAEKKPVFSIRLYTLLQLTGLLEKEGFRIQRGNWWGDFEGAKLSTDAPRMIVLGQKY